MREGGRGYAVDVAEGIGVRSGSDEKSSVAE